jgi:cytochrome c-type biogenesis protein CcmH/NrfF
MPSQRPHHRKSRKVISKFALLVLVASLSPTLFAQSAEEIESPAVTRVVEKLNCSCGCKMNMSCQMDPYPGCRICYAHRKRVLEMQKAGISDSAILDQIAQQEGKAILVNPPGTLGSMTFYSAGILGLILVLFVIRKYSRKGVAAVSAGGPGIDDPALIRYREQIEKETAKLE